MIGYIWSVIVNVIGVIVTIVILGKADTESSKIIFSLLALIYINLVSFTGAMGYAKDKELVGFVQEFKRVRKLIGEEDNEYDKGQEQKMREKIEKAEKYFWINSAFNFIVYVIILINLLSAL